MNLLVTGGCGFIGSNFINYYMNKYSNVKIINIDALYYCASIYNITEKVRNNSNYTFIKGNLNDYDLMKNILEKYSITHVIHFAAQSHVDNSFNDSLQYTFDNVKGTHTLLEAIKNVNLKIVLLHFSTDEVYGESALDEDEKTEESILCPTNPYSASKAAAEMYVRSYMFSFGLKAIITRGNNVYGENQYPEKLIPKFIKMLKNNKKCSIHGKGESIRNFIHVCDVCTAVDIILKFGTFSEIYNIGSDSTNEKSVLEVAKMLIKKINNDDNYDKYLEYVDDRPFNDKRYFISNNKLKELGWIQTIEFDKSIDNLINSFEITDDISIFLYRNVVCKETNKKWNEIYNKIRENGDYHVTIICNSKKDQVESYQKLTNCKIIDSEFNFKNNLIPYYYYFIENNSSKAIIITDDFKLDKLNDILKSEKKADINIFEKKNTDNCDRVNEIKLLSKYNNNELIKLYDSKEWNGIKNMSMLISYEKLKKIQNEFDIFNYLIELNNVKNNIFENLLGLFVHKVSL